MMKNRLKLPVLILLLLLSIFTFSQKHEMWGVTAEGGPSGWGSIFKVDSVANNLTIVYDFPNINVSKPGNVKLLELPNGKLYGTTTTASGNSDGTIFEYDPVLNQTTVVLNFDSTDGETPNCGLILAPNGMLYGNTIDGGINNNGTLYSFNPISKALSTIHVFKDSTTGGNPIGDLLLASNGKIYGLTSSFAGAFNRGGIYELDISTNSVLNKATFSNPIDGQFPTGRLIQAANGKLYGITNLGGVNNLGVLFEYDPVIDTLIKKIDFDNSIGEQPIGSLCAAANGKLYGMTRRGGLNNKGTLYEYNISTNTILKKLDFTSGSIFSPSTGLIEDTIGTLLSFTGRNVFTYNYLTDSLISKANFYSIGINSIAGDLVKTSTSRYFGLAGTINGDYNGGIFEYTKNTDSLSIKARFNYNLVGGLPHTTLFQAENGLVYGTTVIGGKYNRGVIFEVNPKNNSVRKLADLSFEVLYQLIQASNKKLYGVGYSVSGRGDIFELDLSTDSLTVVHTFNTSGINTPVGRLLEASNGKLYGIGQKYLSGGLGGIFEYDIQADTLLDKYVFLNSFPERYSGGLIESNNKLYGVNATGGVHGNGAIYEFDLLTNSYSTKYNFVDSLLNPNGELLETTNGVFIGTTQLGGAYSVFGASGSGILYEYNKNNNIFTIKSLFVRDSTGYYAHGGIIKGGNGNYYGLTKYGGRNSNGVLFEYNTSTNINLPKQSLSVSSTGGIPFSSLTKVLVCPSATVTSLGGSLKADVSNVTYQWLDCNNNYAIIPNETGQLFTATAIGNYAVEITSNGCIDTSTCYPITVVGISVNQLNNNLAVFPNPTNSDVTLSLGGMYGAFTTQVYNVHGMLINERIHQSTNQVEVVLGESEGIYFIHLITNSGEKVVRKVVKN